jgi:hypothetical protein
MKTLAHEELLALIPVGSRFSKRDNPSALADYLVRRLSGMSASRARAPEPCRIQGGIASLEFRNGRSTLVSHSSRSAQDLLSLFASINEAEIKGGYLSHSDHTIAEPSAVELAENFSLAVSRWVTTGFPVVSKKEYDSRLAVCSSCEFWDAQARLGLGKCKHKKCGCTRFKLWLATEQCPIGKWAD